jgi:hypothetical protein
MQSKVFYGGKVAEFPCQIFGVNHALHAVRCLDGLWLFVFRFFDTLLLQFFV